MALFGGDLIVSFSKAAILVVCMFLLMFSLAWILVCL